MILLSFYKTKAMNTGERTERLETVQEVVENANRPNTAPDNGPSKTGDAKNLAAQLGRPAIPERKRNNELDKRKDPTGNIPLS